MCPRLSGVGEAHLSESQCLVAEAREGDRIINGALTSQSSSVRKSQGYKTDSCAQHLA